MKLTSGIWNEMQDINFDVNKKVRYQTDEKTYQRPDFWEPADKVGDCEDYVLRKRQHLLDKGWSHDDLSIATGWTDKGEYHAVLMIHTVRGSYVLDNRTDRVIPWNKAGYTWDKIQHGNRWYAVKEETG